MISSSNASFLFLRRHRNNHTASAHPLVSSDFSVSHFGAPRVPRRNNRLAKLTAVLYPRLCIGINCDGIADNVAFDVNTAAAGNSGRSDQCRPVGSMPAGRRIMAEPPRPGLGGRLRAPLGSQKVTGAGRAALLECRAGGGGRVFLVLPVLSSDGPTGRSPAESATYIGNTEQCFPIPPPGERSRDQVWCRYVLS